MIRKAAAAAGLVLIIASRAWGAEPAVLEVFELQTTSSGAAFYYEQPSAPVHVTSPTGEFTVSYATTTLDTGPTGHALSSAAWPGATAANAPKFARDAAAYEFISRGYPEGLFPQIPNYPLRAETFSPQGPADADNGAPGVLEMLANSQDQSSSSRSRVMGSALPGVASVGQMVTKASTRVDKGLAISEGTSTINGLNLYNGEVTIDSIVTTGKATSDGEKAGVSGRTLIQGLRVRGLGFDIDERGFVIGTRPPEPVGAVVNEIARQYLAQAGITLIVAGPIDQLSGPMATRTLGGLIITFETAKLERYVQSLPADMRRVITEDVKLDKTVTIMIGSVFVKAAAAPTPQLLEELTSDFGSFGTDEGGADLPTQVLGESLESSPALDDSIPADSAAGASPREPIALSPVGAPAEPFNGIPAALVGFMLLLGALASGLLQRLWRWLLFAAPAPAAAACPLEKGDRG